MSTPKSTNITWHGANVTPQEREAAMSQRGCVVWFTGLSGSGKSTIVRRTEQMLLEKGVTAYALDGDNLRHGLNADLAAPGARGTGSYRARCAGRSAR